MKLSVLQEICSHYKFYCGGSITAVSPSELKLFFHDKLHNGAQVLNFANHNNNDVLDTLVMNCVKATFGKGTEEVLDDDYRKAFSMDKSDFALSIDNITDFVINNIQLQLVPSSKQNVDIEKYKLNIYTTGGFFKEHRDTPSCSSMFGSLVICLPTKFTGGALVLKKNDDDVKRFDWDQNCDKIQWAAFFGDIIHSVEEVTRSKTFRIFFYKKI